MFVPEAVKSIKARILYGRMDEYGRQAINIEIPGIGVLVCEHDASSDVDGEQTVMDFGFDWHDETAYRALFGEDGRVFDGEVEAGEIFDLEGR